MAEKKESLTRKNVHVFDVDLVQKYIHYVSCCPVTVNACFFAL